MNRRKFLSLLLVAAVSASAVTGCSLGRNKEAVDFSQKYLEDVLSVDLDKISDKLNDEDGISDYEDHVKDLEALSVMFGDCEYEMTDYKKNGDRIDIGYTLYIPDFEALEGKEYKDFEALMDAVSDLDQIEYEIDFTLVQKNDKWLVEDAESTLELYGDILESIDKAQIDYLLGYEGTIEVIRGYYPELALALEHTAADPYSQGVNYNLSYGGIQVVVDEFYSEEACFGLFTDLVEIWCDVTPDEDDTYYYYNANGQASGVVRSGNVMVQIYDCDGTHYDLVNEMLGGLQELV